MYGPFDNCAFKADYKIYRLGKGLSGTMRIDEEEDPMLTMTACYTGTEFAMGKWRFSKKSDGWYVGEENVSK